MQFEYNSDHPSVEPQTGAPQSTPANNPPDFPPAQPLPCARITTRVFHPQRNQVATVKNVLVKTITSGAAAVGQSSDVSWSSSDDDDMSSSSSSDNGMNDATAAAQPTSKAGPGAGATAVGGTTTAGSTSSEDNNNRAYWIQRTIRDAIYGRVWMAVVLRRRNPADAARDNADWEVSTQYCAIKEMSWQHIRRERSRLAEDPIKEVSAMQYLQQWHSSNRVAQQQNASNADSVEESFRTMLETNIMMPLDLLTDDANLYSVMPYCDGGELFERLDMNERFSEPEARYWMCQVLNVSVFVYTTTVHQ